jgi:hypothetical protein
VWEGRGMCARRTQAGTHARMPHACMPHANMPHVRRPQDARTHARQHVYAAERRGRRAHGGALVYREFAVAIGGRQRPHSEQRQQPTAVFSSPLPSLVPDFRFKSLYSLTPEQRNDGPISACMRACVRVRVSNVHTDVCMCGVCACINTH